MRNLIVAAIVCGSALSGTPAVAARSLAIEAATPNVVAVQYYGPSWREREEWRRRQEWRQRREYRRERAERNGYGYGPPPQPYYGRPRY